MIFFSGSLLDQVKVKNSTLEKIDFDGAKVRKEIFINGKSIINHVPIKDYSNFLNEVN